MSVWLAYASNLPISSMNETVIIDKGLHMKKTLLTTFLLSVIFCSLAHAEPMTREQGDAIVNELKQIRILLEKQQRPQPQQAAAPAKPELVTIKGGGPHTLGKADAPLVLIEYTDYQCPYCKRFYDTTFAEIKKNLIDTGKVRFISRNLPLPFHGNAKKAAQAAFCAGEQGRYWEMRDSLFRNQNRLEVEAITGYANGLSLKADAFKNCMDSGKFAKEISDEAAYGGTLGITGTPTFVLGTVKGDSVEGRKIVGAQPYAAFEAQVNELLRDIPKR